jgi:hypothetical protein
MEISFFALPSHSSEQWALFRGQSKKRYLHAHQNVSFMYNPEAKCHGQMLKCYVKTGMQHDTEPIMQELLNHTNEFKAPAILLCNQVT